MNRSASSPGGLSRRQAMRLAAAGVVGFSTSGWIEALAADAAGHPSRRKSCILLWMTGGPSQLDTFDPKPGHANGGEFKAIETAVPGIRISEHLPEAGPADEGDRDHPLDEHQGGRSRPGDLQPADRLSADRPDPIPDAGLAGGQGARLGGIRAAELRQHRAGPGLQPGGVQPGFLGPQFAPLVVGERGAAGPTEAGGAGNRVPGRGPGPCPPAWTRSGRTPGSACWARSARTSSPPIPGSARSATRTRIDGPSG